MKSIGGIVISAVSIVLILGIVFYLYKAGFFDSIALKIKNMKGSRKLKKIKFKNNNFIHFSSCKMIGKDGVDYGKKPASFFKLAQSSAFSADHGPEKIFDDNLTTFQHTGIPNDGWLTIEFTVPQVITSIVFEGSPTQGPRSLGMVVELTDEEDKLIKSIVMGATPNFECTLTAEDYMFK